MKRQTGKLQQVVVAYKFFLLLFLKHGNVICLGFELSLTVTFENELISVQFLSFIIS